MPCPRGVHPAYLRHKPTNQVYVRVPDGSGGRKVVYPGAHGSAESKAEYRRLLAKLDAAASRAVAAEQAPMLAGPRDIIVSEVYRDFWAHAQHHYRRADGTATNELPQFRQTFRLVRELYGHTPAREFGPLALKAVRQKMIDAGWSRKLINQRVGRIKRVFRASRWARRRCGPTCTSAPSYSPSQASWGNSTCRTSRTPRPWRRWTSTRTWRRASRRRSGRS
jgi:hypothetical protein